MRLLYIIIDGGTFCVGVVLQKICRLLKSVQVINKTWTFIWEEGQGVGFTLFQLDLWTIYHIILVNYTTYYIRIY